MRRIGSRVVSWLVAVAITALLSPVAFAAVPIGTNTVNSAAIIPADGTSGQSLTTGSGVKTGHIQDGAVTASKLGIVCPTGNYLQYVFGSGWVCSAGIAGPQGPVGPQGPTGIQGPVGPAPHYANTIIVAKNGGDFDELGAALNFITDATAENRYLIKIMPGIYSSPQVLSLKSYVDIEGSGKSNTTINSQFNVSNTDDQINISNINIGSDMMVYHSTIVANNVNITTNQSQLAAIYFDNGTLLGRNVEIRAVGNSTGRMIGIAGFSNYDIYLENSSIYVNNGSGSARALEIGGSVGNHVYKNVDFEAVGLVGYDIPSFGISSFWGATIRVYNSRIKTQMELGGGSTLIANSEIFGSIPTISNVKTVNCFNQSFIRIADQ